MSRLFKSLLAPVIAAVLATGAANGAFYQWSKTAASNSSADPSINWAEGMSPSSVNDSARAMMARAAEYRDDISGLVSTGGTATALTITTNQGLSATPNDGQLIAFTMSVTNGASPTLSADAGTAYPLQTAPGSAVPSGALILGSTYTAKFSVANSAWMVRNYYSNSLTVPLGVPMAYTGDTAPNSNFVLAYGQCISRTTYAAYFALVGTRFGACDGTTTFGIPDLRGRTIFGVDNMGGTPANRITAAGGNYDGTVVGGAGGAQNHVLVAAEAPVVTLTTNVSDTRTWALGYQGVGVGATGGTSVMSDAGNNQSKNVTVVSGSISASTSSNAGGGSHSILNPGISLNYIIRVL